MEAMNPSDEVTVVVRRHILPGHEAQFEHAMRDFVNFVLTCPGHVGISVLRPNDGNGEYVVVDRFANAAARKALVSSPEYERWMKLLGAHTEGEPDMQEMNGLDAWLNQPGSPMKTPPRYKTAVATYLGVFLFPVQCLRGGSADLGIHASDQPHAFFLAFQQAGGSGCGNNP